MRRLAALAFVLLSLTGCGTTEPVAPLKAAEPAKAPVPIDPPAGTVTDLAPSPEGMAYDATTDILAVAVREPNRLLLIQGATGRVVQSVPLPGHARHLQIAAPGGPVLVPAEDSNMLLTVALPGGAVTATPVGNYPHDATQTAAGDILVADERGGTLSVLRDGAVVHEFDDPTQPGGVIAVGETVAVVDVGAFTVSTYDLGAQTRVASVSAGDGPTHLVADVRGDLLVADTRGNQILVFSVDPLGMLRAYPLPGTPYGVAYDPTRDQLWVTLTATNEVVALDMSGVTPREVRRFPSVRQPNTVAVDPATGRVWVASRTTGELQTVDP